MRRAGFVLSAAVLVGLTGMVASQQATGPVQLDLMAVEDSGDYLLYRHRASVDPSSSWAVSQIFMGVSATSGTPAALASSGSGLFDDLTSLGPPPDPYAPVGPMMPNGWNSVLTGTAELGWQSDAGIWTHFDSIAPGASLSGFGVRSPYLPGVVTMRALPTFQSCCSPPEDIDATVPEDLAFTGYTVGPRYDSAEVDLDLLQSQVSTVCAAPLWIDSASLCSEILDSLAVAEARLEINDYEGAAVATKGITNLADRNREDRGGEVHDNAYWLLKWNADHIRNSFPTDPAPPHPPRMDSTGSTREARRAGT